MLSMKKKLKIEIRNSQESLVVISRINSEKMNLEEQ